MKDKIITMDLRDNLKASIQKEIEQLPVLLETLEPEKRLNIVCKLLPYILPKVDTISSKEGEPFTHENW